MYKVMIVDDEPFIRQGLRVLINWEEYGFEICCEAENGIEAFEQAKIFKPELIITDIKMPEMGGLELINKCENMSIIDSKYIVLSGFSDFEYARSAMRLSVVNYILKPVNEEELIESLKDIREELDLKNKQLLTKFDNKIFVNEILKKIVNGEIEERKSGKIRDYIPEYENGEFIYIIVQPINCSHYLDLAKTDIDEMSIEVRKTILRTIGEDVSIYVINENIGQGILVSEKMIYKHENSLNLMLKRIADDIFTKMKLQVIVYTGKKVKGIRLIKESRDSCINSININFLLNRKGIVSWDEIENFNYNFEINKLFNELMESVEKNNLDKITENIEIICTNIQIECVAPEIIKANIASFELEVIKLITSMDGDTEQLSNSIRSFQFDFMDIFDIKEGLREFCVLASIYINNLKETKKSGIPYQVKDYIDLNYNKDIKLKSISQYFYINTIYLGQIFKKKFGISFNDYLNNLRIEKAKELIECKKFKIRDISDMVGYKDSNYFINNFEKITNTTPSEYEKKL